MAGCLSAHTVLVGHNRRGIANVALLEDVLRGRSMSSLHLVAMVAPLGSQLLGKGLVAYQVGLSRLQALPRRCCNRVGNARNLSGISD